MSVCFFIVVNPNDLFKYRFWKKTACYNLNEVWDWFKFNRVWEPAGAVSSKTISTKVSCFFLCCEELIRCATYTESVGHNVMTFGVVHTTLLNTQLQSWISRRCQCLLSYDIFNAQFLWSVMLLPRITCSSTSILFCFCCRL